MPLSEVEELSLLLPQPASMEAHRVSAKMAERTFFMSNDLPFAFIFVFLTAFMITAQCKVREGGNVKSM